MASFLGTSRAVALSATLACSDSPAAPELPESWTTIQRTGYRLLFTAPDSASAFRLALMLDDALAEPIAATLNAAPRQFDFRVLPSRESMTQYWRTAWGQPSLTTQCWMIAAGWHSELDVLSPRVWSEQSCGHEPTESHQRAVIAHEMVHVLHAQRNTAYDALARDRPWITEGLAIWASGQFESEYASTARRLVREGLNPSSFASLWQSQGSYALAGSVFAFIESRFGRATALAAVADRTQSELLGRLELSEEALLQRWHEWMMQ